MQQCSHAVQDVSWKRGGERRWLCLGERKSLGSDVCFRLLLKVNKGLPQRMWGRVYSQENGGYQGAGIISFEKYLFIYFLAAHWLSLVVAIRSCSSLQCPGFSLQWLLLLQSTGFRCRGFSRCSACGLRSVAHGLSCSATCGIFPSQRSNSGPLPGQAGS